MRLQIHPVRLFKERYGLLPIVLISAIVKGCVFLLGIAIMGFLSTRAGLPSCGSSSASNVSVYIAPYPDIEAYTDYRDLYLRCLVTPFLSGSGAYSLPIVNNYPPLFIYTLALFARLGSFVWFAAIPLVAFDILTVIPFYKICEDFVFKENSKRLSFAASLVWIVNPLNLFYNDLMWLNTAPTTFFLLVSVFLFLKKRYSLSSLSLALSTGYKQVSFIIFPLFAVIMWRKEGFSKKLALFLSIYTVSLVLISTPFVFTQTQFYFWALSFPIFGTPSGYSSSGGGGENCGASASCFSYNLSDPTKLTTFLGIIQGVNLKGIAVASYSYLNYIFAFAFVSLLAYAAFRSKREEFSQSDVLVLCLAAFSIFFAFFGRGVYKYYFTTITALSVPFLKSRKNALIFEAFCLTLLFIPREATPWMAVLLLTLMPNILDAQRCTEKSGMVNC